MIRSIVFSLRCALLAILALALVSTRPAMMFSHAMPAAEHGCGMTIATHHSSHSDHRCPTTEDGACCDDCLCACPITADVASPLVVLAATYTHVFTVVARPAEIVRTRQPLALRLPPPLGPPLLVRS